MQLCPYHHTPTHAHLQHAGEAGALVLRGLPKVHGARDVGGAAVVLPAAVQQQQRAGVHAAAGARLGAVVDDGAVWPRTRNGREARLDKPLLRRAARREVLVHLNLGQAGACAGRQCRRKGS